MRQDLGGYAARAGVGHYGLLKGVADFPHIALSIHSIKGFGDGGGNIEKADAPVKEGGDRLFVGRVHRRWRAAAGDHG